MKQALVTGAGGFIGHHLVKRLKAEGYWVRGIDIKRPEFEESAADEFWLRDLRRPYAAQEAIGREPMDEVYALAADMGGMGFISSNHATILYNNLMINLHTIEAARLNGCKRYFYTSSACVYPQNIQKSAAAFKLTENDAYPADPEDAYGWEKLTTEKLCEYYRGEFGLDSRIVRFHNIFGPLGTWRGGREKAPAALCRKIAEAKRDGLDFIEVWGDGKQTRSFCYISDCIEGIRRLMQSDCIKPLNLGQDRLISINDLAKMIMVIADINLEIRHIEGPQGVRGRNSDNRKLKEVLNWEPNVSLEQGLKITYDWIEGQVNA